MPRNNDLKYVEKKKKGQIDRIIVSLEGDTSGAFTRIAKKYQQIKRIEELCKEKRENLNADVKTKIRALFDAEDAIHTRVVETISLTATLSKAVASSQIETFDLDGYVEELESLIGDLGGKLVELRKKYTSFEDVDAKDESLRVKVIESITGSIKNWLANSLKSFINFFSIWDTKYKKLKNKLSTVTEARNIGVGYYLHNNEDKVLAGPFDTLASARKSKHYIKNMKIIFHSKTPLMETVSDFGKIVFDQLGGDVFKTKYGVHNAIYGMVDVMFGVGSNEEAVTEIKISQPHGKTTYNLEFLQTRKHPIPRTITTVKHLDLSIQDVKDCICMIFSNDLTESTEIQIANTIKAEDEKSKQRIKTLKITQYDMLIAAKRFEEAKKILQSMDQNNSWVKEKLKTTNV